ncbi:hypothetical protein [Mycolicibacterium iranicum]|uniref:Uncharacterized protein n=1 Tax=Mycolicibacterium iranicum TaxID=912594 RepID=A0A1X1X3J9_MYCIR|nr:hypothetical protein [Mycolicibacterium iranicum]MCZ0728864.1 hypothetical protein [Mycolicibacterium iranicum]ORV93288.1 hypothetical protein AWC12_00055 [Mycolicibacterium iranicum]
MAKATLRKLLAAVAIVGMLASGIGIASFMIFGGRDQQQEATSPRYTPPTPPPPSVPTAKEFQITVNVTASQCDPSNTVCLYTYTIDPKYVGLHPFPETPFTVEYEVVGGLAPQPGRFTVSGQQAEIFKDVSVEVAPGARLSANVLRVVEGAPPPPPPPPGEAPPADAPPAP